LKRRLAAQNNQYGGTDGTIAIANAIMKALG
jgi:hypothetical protein